MTSRQKSDDARIPRLRVKRVLGLSVIVPRHNFGTLEFSYCAEVWKSDVVCKVGPTIPISFIDLSPLFYIGILKAKCFIHQHLLNSLRLLQHSSESYGFKHIVRNQVARLLPRAHGHYRSRTSGGQMLPNSNDWAECLYLLYLSVCSPFTSVWTTTILAPK